MSVDEGVCLETILPSSAVIQKKRKPLIIKGQFQHQDLIRLRESLLPNGLCIQVVAKDRDEMNSLRDES